MERGTLLGRLTWQLGQVVATRPETLRAKSITLDLPHWIGHQVGQHVLERVLKENAQGTHDITIWFDKGQSGPTCALSVGPCSAHRLCQVLEEDTLAFLDTGDG